ncbi:DUF4159 domain-containing protein [Acidiphilium acidophilum]|uniref:DUF4159 domain-containing protein n=1 Tax=Acidiphilium acidophilum TaxID=76588 RepID=UPI002E8E70C3|nr:DUF4159 domain-containing protein [Acidiphilium acidophilum]
MIGPLSFAAPAILAGLALLPALYFMLRATPPAPRRQVFPPLRLLHDILPTERSPVRMPWWLLLLRLLAAALVIIGFADPEIVPPPLLPGHGPILLAIDNGWGAAQDFPARLTAARHLVDQAGTRGVVLLPTAATATGQQPRASDVLTRAAALAALGALHAEPWPSDRAADTRATDAIRRHIPDLTGVYLTDGLAEPGSASFVAALAPARLITGDTTDLRLLAPPHLAANGALVATVLTLPHPGRIDQPVLAETASGVALARATIKIGPGRTQGSASFDLPVALAGKIARLALPGMAAPSGVALLDGATSRVVVGLVSGGTANPEQRLLGTLYYVRRALPPGTTIRTGSLDDLIASGANALIMADLPLNPADIARLHHFMAAGGVAIRFAGPLTAATKDALTPDPLLPGVRALGSALAAGKPEAIAAFDRGSPLAGLPLPASATVSRQILVNPATLDPATVWARLSDGTPIVIGARQGRGMLVSILTTANAAWSTWPISADFPALIDRLVHLGKGAVPKSGWLHAIRVLDGSGALVLPGSGVRPLEATGFAHARISPAHPPGLWGDAHGTIALDLGDHVPPLARAPLPAGVPVTNLDSIPRARRFGPDILGLALALLIADAAITLLLRGAIRLRGAALLLMGLIGFAMPPPAHAQSNDAHNSAHDAPPGALAPMLAYVRTGDANTDAVSRAGLAAISDQVDQETAAHLAAPRGVTPGIDNLNLYPLLYWPITATTTPPGKPACHALDAFMAGGGLLVIDTDGGGSDLPGSGAGFDPGATAALRRATACLAIPPLERLTDRDTLAHTFFLNRSFPGRFDGAPVYIAAKGARDADGVSPVVIGSNDWAGAWALDGAGMPMRALLPGSPGQRQAANWFGVNLVMYALTGTYKSDQVQIPAILRRLAQ